MTQKGLRFGIFCFAKNHCPELRPGLKEFAEKEKVLTQSLFILWT